MSQPFPAEHVRFGHRVRARVVATLAMLVAVVATALVLGPAPTASAYTDWTEFGQRGTYSVNAEHGFVSMIIGRQSPTGKIFTTNGVTVSPTMAAQEQSVRVFYHLQRSDPGKTPFDTIVTGEVSVEFTTPYDAAHNFGPYEFRDLPAAEFGYYYRITYTIEWWDKKTGTKVATTSVLPSKGESHCDTNDPSCEALDFFLKM